jgi:hypothetical protein
LGKSTVVTNPNSSQIEIGELLFFHPFFLLKNPGIKSKLKAEKGAVATA